jgi:uridine kinase
MQITDSIANRFIKKSNGILLVGICGRAGAGKTTLTKNITEELRKLGIDCFGYSGDWRFRLDSKERKELFSNKWKEGLNQYLLAINQFTWWDFNKIKEDITSLSEGLTLVIDNAYNQVTGKKEMRIDFKSIKRGVIFYESNILGGIEILDKMDLIIVINTPHATSFKRLIERDSSRRSITELAARNIITTYSENLFFQNLFEKFSQKLLICDSDGTMGSFPKIEKVNDIPVPIPENISFKISKNPIFCDIDNFLLKSENTEPIKIMIDALNHLKSLKKQGYYLVAVTSHSYPFQILNELKSQGLEFDRIISDLPQGDRFLIQNKNWKIIS